MIASIQAIVAFRTEDQKAAISGVQVGASENYRSPRAAVESALVGTRRHLELDIVAGSPHAESGELLLNSGARWLAPEFGTQKDCVDFAVPGQPLI